MLQLDVIRLTEAYVTGASASVLAREAGVSVWVVLHRLRAEGVEIRSAKTQNQRWLTLTDQQAARLRNVVDGLLLGDGSIDRKGFLRLEQTESRVGWLDQIEGQLHEIGAATNRLPIIPRTRYIEGRQVHAKASQLLYTPSYGEIKEHRVRWYPAGLKRVPLDLHLTARVVAHWFAGDGTSAPDGALTFCTDGFLEQDTRTLGLNLSQTIGIHVAINSSQREGQYKLIVRRLDDAVVLANYIRAELPACCLYKLRHVRNRIRK